MHPVIIMPEGAKKNYCLDQWKNLAKKKVAKLTLHVLRRKHRHRSDTWLRCQSGCYCCRRSRPGWPPSPGYRSLFGKWSHRTLFHHSCDLKTHHDIFSSIKCSEMHKVHRFISVIICFEQWVSLKHITAKQLSDYTSILKYISILITFQSTEIYRRENTDRVSTLTDIFITSFCSESTRPHIFGLHLK